MPAYGRLVLSDPSGDEQTFELAKSLVTIGRDPVSDIVLGDERVSRSHARVEEEQGKVSLVDLNSANGSRLNGQPVQRARLKPGDLILLGGCTLRYELGAAGEADEVVPIDSLAHLEQTFAMQTVNMTLYDTSRPRLVVHLPDKTWEVALTGERYTLGRHPESDIYLPYERVSRQHAVIERRARGYVIRDLGSTNGTWLGTAPIQERRLAPGDDLRVGSARLAFKDAYASADLTLVDQPFAPAGQPGGRMPVVFVPGLMGSELWSGSERIWPNVRFLFSNPEAVAVPSKIPIEARGIVNEVVIVPNLIKQEQYNRLGDFLVEGLGYQRGLDLMEFAYDWRLDVRQSARKLASAIEAWGVQGPVVIIAHSLGCLVTRYYIERLGGKSRVERAIFLGGPHYGVPKAIANLIMKVDLLPFGLLGDRLRRVLSTFPSLYQILPIYNSVFDQHGAPVQVLDDESWLPEAQRPLLRAAREFRHELGRRLSVPSCSIFGYGLKTVNRINVTRSPSGDWTGLEMVVEESGDSTIPDSSTVLEGSDIHPVAQYHGSLYVDNDVKMRLKLELTGLRRRA